MSTSENAILKDTERGAAVEADGNAPTQSVQLGGGISLGLDSQNDPQAQALGPNNERLEQAAPRLVNALRELVVQYRQEGIVARRHEIRRIRQARLFWQGLQYAWWNPQDMNWHLPYESKIYDDRRCGGDAALPVRHEFVSGVRAVVYFGDQPGRAGDALLSAVGASRSRTSPRRKAASQVSRAGRAE